MHLSLRAPAKVNLDLLVCGRRADGYHLLDSLFVPVTLYDRLAVASFRACRGRPSARVDTSWDAPGVGLGLLESNNTIVRAVEAFARAGQLEIELQLRVEKRIPIGGGLGGGSSDAATILAFLAGACPGVVDASTLGRVALEVGADVPFFLTGGLCRVTGVGEVVEPVDAAIPSHLVLGWDGTGLATREVFRCYDRALTIETDPSMNRRPASRDAALLCSHRNDLEWAARALHPGIGALQDAFLAEGAVRAAMTGSGSTVFGVAADEEQGRRIAERLRRRGYWAKAVRVIRQRSAYKGRFNG